MTTDQLNNTSVEELALEAQDAIGDGMQTGDSVTIEGGVSGVVEVLDAGHSWVWDIRNGARSKVNNNMLRAQLGKLDPDTKQRVFTTNAKYPGMPNPILGTFKCVFHKEAPNRAELDALGHPVCKKSNLISPTEVENHARNRHPREWRQVYEATEKIANDRRAQIEELQLNQLLANAAAQAPAAPAEPPPVAAQPVATPAPVIPPTPVKLPHIVPVEITAVKSDNRTDCSAPFCTWFSAAPKANSRKNAFYKHKKTHE